MFEREPGHNAERELWQSVLMQAVNDALQGVATGGSTSNETRIRMTEEARRYLTTPSQDLSTVCNLAGLDPVAVMEAMRKQIAAAPAPEELIGKPRPKKPKPEKKLKPPVMIAYKGETLSAEDWSERTGVPAQVIRRRIRHNHKMTVEQILTYSTEQGQQLAGRAFGRGRGNTRRTAPPKVKSRTSRPAVIYSHNGESLTLKQWADRTGIKKGTLSKRLRLGMAFGDALKVEDMRRAT